jgi:hypothetical protein
LNEIRKHEGPITCGYDPTIGRIFPKRVPELKNPRYGIQYINEPVRELGCYDRETGGCKKLTEALWVSLGLSNVAFSERMHPFAVSTVFDLRRLLPKEELGNPGLQNYVASIAVHGDLSLGRTVDELASDMRKNFQMRVERGDVFGHMRSVQNVVYKPWRNRMPPGLGLEVSSIGRIRIGSPVKDCHITLMAPAQMELGSISLMCYTIEHRERKSKQFVGQFQYTSKELHDLDAYVLAESVRYGLKNIDGHATVGSTIAELRQFQKLIS